VQSQAGSRASKRSNVDETLFAGKKTQSKQAAATISIEELRKIRGNTEKNNQVDAVIISAAEMARIKDATVIKSKE
jgi:hypothetical protein